jgi:putative membrane protein
MRRLALAGGVAAIVVVFLPRVQHDALQLLSVHMIQHLLLILVAAPLLVLSRALEPLERLAAIRGFAQPVPAWSLFVGVFLFWHWPVAFEWAANGPVSSALELLSIGFAAWLFWSVALTQTNLPTLSYGARALWVITAAVATDLPGVIMLFSPRAFCAMPQESAWRWDLTPLEDQQIAGLLMWVPANLVFFAIAMTLFARWMVAASPMSRGKSPGEMVPR